MIRKAVKEDAAQIAILIVAAMGNLAQQFRASAKQDEVLALFEYFIGLKDNQYSFENTLVYVSADKVVGAVNGYDGGILEELRKPFLTYINKNYHEDPFILENESEVGEFYLDTLSVHPVYQGKGIGKALLKAAIDWAKVLGHQKIGLLVDFANPAAKRLYLKVGFIETDIKNLLGQKYDHLVYRY